MIIWMVLVCPLGYDPPNPREDMGGPLDGMGGGKYTEESKGTGRHAREENRGGRVRVFHEIKSIHCIIHYGYKKEETNKNRRLFES